MISDLSSATPTLGDKTDIGGLLINAPRVDGVAMPGANSVSLAALFGQMPFETEFRRATSGHAGGLWWRQFILDAIPFERSLDIVAGEGPMIGPRTAFYYSVPPTP